MPKDAHGYISEGLHLLREGLAPFVQKRLESNLSGHWKVELARRYPAIRRFVEDGEILWDVAVLLKTMMIFWREAFNDLRKPARSHVEEVLVVRNNWAHQQDLTHEDADRGIDTMRRLLVAIDKKGADVKGILDRLETLRGEMRPVTRQDANSAPAFDLNCYTPKVR